MTSSTETAEDRISGLSGRLRRLRTGASVGSFDRWLLIAGAILMPLGIALIVIGWVGASGTTLGYQQTDYLISGGILGLALTIAGGFTYFAYWQTVRIREARTQSAAMTRAVGRLETLLAGGAATEITGIEPVPAVYVATAGGTVFHRPDCAAVAGRDDISEVDIATTTLSACLICTPLDPGVNPPEFTELASAVNNWGRWGEDDERGTLNLITTATIRDAAGLVRDGKRFSLAIPMSESGPQLGFVAGRTNPIRTTIARHELLGKNEHGVRFNDDAVSMGVQSATHWDALAHVSYDGRMYNGFPTSIIDDTGATRLGAEKLGPITSRGVLLDLARSAGVDRLDGGVALTAADLDRAAEFGKVSIKSGDILLLRTGQIQHLHAGDKMAYSISTAGPSMQTVRWFHDHDVAAVATDNLSFEVFPGEHKGLLLPVHMVHIVEMGLVQGQNFDLEELAADCAADGRYSFLLSASPEPIVHAAGTPVAPIAIK